jgi:hypothetical protein
MFLRALRVNAKQLGTDLFFESSVRHYLPDESLGTWEIGGPTTHVRDVAGVEPEDFLTIARRYVNAADTRRTAGGLLRQIGRFMLIGLVPGHRLARFERLQQHPQLAHPRYSAESTVWRNEHTAMAESTHYRFGAIEVPPVSVDLNAAAGSKGHLRNGDMQGGTQATAVPGQSLRR